jgi:hypothetical protein
MANKGGRSMKLTAAEDRCFERMANACDKINMCAQCPDEKTCEHLADKVITRVRLITGAGVRRGNSKLLAAGKGEVSGGRRR